jgi:hypothetical protein
MNLWVDANVSENHTVSIFRAEEISTFWRNILIFSEEDGDSVSPKRWYLPRSSHSVATQKTNINIFTAVRTSHLIQYCICIEA